MHRLTVLCFGLLAALPAAQALAGTIRGTLRDSDGAVVNAGERLGAAPSQTSP